MQHIYFLKRSCPSRAIGSRFLAVCDIMGAKYSIPLMRCRYNWRNTKGIHIWTTATSGGMNFHWKTSLQIVFLLRCFHVIQKAIMDSSRWNFTQVKVRIRLAKCVIHMCTRIWPTTFNEWCPSGRNFKRFYIWILWYKILINIYHCRAVAWRAEPKLRNPVIFYCYVLAMWRRPELSNTMKHKYPTSVKFTRQLCEKWWSEAHPL